MEQQIVIGGLICVTLIFLAIISCGTLILKEAIKAAGDKEPAIFGRIGGDGNAMRILILFIAFITFFYLAVLKDMNPAQLSFLSAVAGFTLGGLKNPKATTTP